MKKRVCSVVLVAILIVTSMVPVFGEITVKNPFEDVNKGTYYHDSVLWAYSSGVTQGMSNSKFGPDNTCTRGQVVTFLWRSLGEPEPKTTSNPFTDVKSSDYYYKPVLWAVENGITTGTSSTKFSPNSKCTSAHVLTFLWRANGEPESGNSELLEKYSGKYYASAAAWADNNGFFAVVPKAFSPNSESPRADIVTYLYINSGAPKIESNENNFVLPPTNIRIVAQDTDAVYLQWDKVFGADYYYFYYQEDGEDNYWYDTDQNTGEQIRMTYGSDYSAVLYGLENGKTYNIIVTSVKNGVESLDSMIFSFEFISDSNIDILRDVIIKNTISTNGLYKITTGMMEGSSYVYYTALVYDPSEDEIYIECVTSYYSGDQVANFIFLDGAPERVSNNKRIAYFYKEADGTTSVGETVINPKIFKQSSKIFFDYYYSPYGDLVKPEDEGLSTVLTKKCLREANNILAMYGLPFDMTDLGFVIFSAT